jgi:recombination protein RecT
MTNNRDIVLRQVNNFTGTLLTKEEEALPKGFNPLRFRQNAITVLNDTKDIEKLKGQEFQIARTLMKGAYLGLDFFNKECYCIIYGGKPSFQTDYKGEIKLAKKYSMNPIKDIYAKLVREGDDYESEIINGQQTVHYKPKPFNNGDVIGAFAVCLFHDGSMLHDEMSKEDIEETRRNYSKMPNGPSWTKSPGEMYKKTILRRLCKLIELDFDNIEQKRAFDEGGDATFDNADEIKEAKEKSVFDDDKEDEDTIQDAEFKIIDDNEELEGQTNMLGGYENATDK